MTALERLAPAYELLALSSSGDGVPFYLARGWRQWRGSTAVLAPEGRQPTPDDDGSIYVLGGGTDIDLQGTLACDWREGDVW